MKEKGMREVTHPFRAIHINENLCAQNALKPLLILLEGEGK
jgi:hypothetical protein